MASAPVVLFTSRDTDPLAPPTRRPRSASAQLRVPMPETATETATSLHVLTRLCQEWQQALLRVARSGNEARELIDIKHSINKANALLSLPARRQKA